MLFTRTPVQGVVVIEPELLVDERGFFARSWCRNEFASQGLSPKLMQCNISFNPHRGTLRGMHYQAAPYEEAKVVRSTKGAIYDVALDLRPHSPTFKQHFGVELTADNHRMLYVPEGCAHGFLTLEDNTEIFYQMSEMYQGDFGRGVRWNDPAFGITWPGEIRVISERDRNYPDFG